MVCVNTQLFNNVMLVKYTKIRKSTWDNNDLHKEKKNL